ncbi:hypothetical protein C8F04DRAFT_1185426 [Mycena alexandri]|uniref:Uncharacterized protein n=1 Tax=Mycena alexandri TaxID=1745969 RepID=A0AAD6WYD5_9AGAR|nr:hypothetical protein C8F04DRAFT_1185426 [Mycena alexandri]
MFNFKTLLFSAAACTPDFGILSDSKAFTLSIEGKTVGYNTTTVATAGFANAPVLAFNNVTWLAAGTGATGNSNPFRLSVPGNESFAITGNLQLQPRANASAQQLFWIECDACDDIAGNGCQITYVGEESTGLCLDLENETAVYKGVLADCAEIGPAKILWA